MWVAIEECKQYHLLEYEVVSKRVCYVRLTRLQQQVLLRRTLMQVEREEAQDEVL